jgi:hypothetical protein
MLTWFLEDEQRTPRGNVGARQGSMNKLFRKRKPSSETKGNNRGKPCRFRVACLVCQPPPGEDAVYVYVSANAKKAVCKSGHVIDCMGGCK